MDDLEIDESLVIPAGELTFEASRSSGPGGQHVNKSSTKITVAFDIDASAALSDTQKDRLRSKLASRLSGEAVLRVSSQRTRSQLSNREDALTKLATLVRKALEQDKPRKRTRPSRVSREKRLEEKKRRSEVKQGRSIVYDERER
jgi:ribosome-associated protein